jgi:anti-anti-sigma factor
MHAGTESEAGRVETAVVEGAPQIRLSGECDLSTAPAVEAQLRALLDNGVRSVVFDLQRVTFMDSSILRIFLMARRHVASEGGEVVLLCRPGFVWRLLSLLEMDQLLRICTPEEWRQQVAAVN